MRDRFSETNSGLLCAMSCILPTSEKFLHNGITQFADLLKVNTSDSGFWSDVMWHGSSFLARLKGRVSVPFLNCANFYFPWRQRFLQYTLYAGALAFGANTAVCEASFSVLTKLITKKRQSMSQCRKTDLAFCQSSTKRLDMDKFLRRFTSDKRRLQLY